jgi:transcriptional regulator with XRE-family HTH domain
MNEFRNNLLDEFKDKDYRESYAEDYLHSFIAMQYRAVREQRGMTQDELAQAIHTKQTAISRLESINNRSRNLNFLLKAAFALGCRLRVSLETFGSLINDEGPRFSREMLQRPSFDDECAQTHKSIAQIADSISSIAAWRAADSDRLSDIRRQMQQAYAEFAEIAQKSSASAALATLQTELRIPTSISGVSTMASPTAGSGKVIPLRPKGAGALENEETHTSIPLSRVS